MPKKKFITTNLKKKKKKNHQESYPFSNTWPKFPLLCGTVVNFSPEMLVCSASECHLLYVTLAAWNCHRGKWKLEIGKQYKSRLVLVLRDGCFQFTSVAQLCPTLCDPMDFSIPGFPVHQQSPEHAQTNVHQVGDPIQPSRPLLSPSPLAFNLS